MLTRISFPVAQLIVTATLLSTSASPALAQFSGSGTFEDPYQESAYPGDIQAALNVIAGQDPAPIAVPQYQAPSGDWYLWDFCWVDESPGADITPGFEDDGTLGRYDFANKKIWLHKTRLSNSGFPPTTVGPGGGGGGGTTGPVTGPLPPPTVLPGLIHELTHADTHPFFPPLGQAHDQCVHLAVYWLALDVMCRLCVEIPSNHHKAYCRGVKIQTKNFNAMKKRLAEQDPSVVCDGESGPASEPGVPDTPPVCECCN